MFTVDKQIGLFNGPMEGVAGGVERVGWGGGGEGGVLTHLPISGITGLDCVPRWGLAIEPTGVS